MTVAPPIRAVLLDSGDTLVDEGTEVKDPTGVVLRAELIPGAAQLVRALHGRCPLALVADGPRASFEHVLGRQHGLLGCFDALAISGDVGVEKPDPRMFRTALGGLGLLDADPASIVMVGNTLERDIAGANALGLVSVWIDWAPRRNKVPRHAGERPQHRIGAPLELLSLLAELPG